MLAWWEAAREAAASLGAVAHSDTVTVNGLSHGSYTKETGRKPRAIFILRLSPSIPWSDVHTKQYFLSS